MMQQTKKKMVLEHLVVHKMNTAADLKQVTSALSHHLCPSHVHSVNTTTKLPANLKQHPSTAVESEARSAQLPSQARCMRCCAPCQHAA